MNISSLTPWLLDFHTIQFSVSSGCFFVLKFVVVLLLLVREDTVRLPTALSCPEVRNNTFVPLLHSSSGCLCQLFTFESGEHLYTFLFASGLTLKLIVLNPSLTSKSGQNHNLLSKSICCLVHGPLWSKDDEKV